MFKGAEELRKILILDGDKELEELAELLEMQQKLDESIYKEKGISKYPVNEVAIALIVELGELMNEFPTKFKYWKSTAIDNREKGLEEYVDCLHFALNITNYLASLDLEDCINAYGFIEFLRYSKSDDCKAFSIDYVLAKIIDVEGTNYTLAYLFELGNKLGFIWKEIYEAYKEKNKVNYERLQNGY